MLSPTTIMRGPQSPATPREAAKRKPSSMDTESASLFTRLRRKPGWLLTLLFLAICTFVFSVAMDRMLEKRVEAREIYENKLLALTLALRERVEGELAKTEFALNILAQDIEQQGTLDERRLRPLLESRLKSGMPQIESFAVLDAEGRVLANSAGDSTREVAAYLADVHRVLAADANLMRAVGRTHITPGAHERVFPLMRRIGPDAHKPIGYIAAEFRTAYLRSMYDSIGLPETGLVMLANSRSQRMLDGHPNGERHADRDLSAQGLFQRFLTANEGSFVDASPNTKVPRLIVFRQLPDYALVVAAAVPMSVATDFWVREEDGLKVRVAMIMLVVGGMFLLINVNMRQAAEKEILLRQANALLEKRVSERTIELQTMVQELSTFSYSVSHDLRTPLRSINGFCQVIEEDYGERLDDYGRDCLRRVRTAAEKMGHLIDRLLELAKLSRVKPSFKETNLSELARDLAEELRQAHPDRKVEFHIEDGLFGNGDETLLRDVLSNLLGNAWKFTRDVTQPEIEFGAIKDKQRTIFYVRDNGVGFDMAHADKLFLPFEKLHPGQGYEGEGIGLATVKRIIDMHHGRVWHSPSTERGATFYFTLGL